MTIYELSSGPGISGICVIRISGQDTSKVIRLLTTKEQKPSEEAAKISLQFLNEETLKI